MEKIKTKDLTKTVLKRVQMYQRKKARNLDSVIMIEGFLPLEEAQKSSYTINEIFYNPFILDKPRLRELILSLQERDDATCYEVTASDLKKISTEIHPQGIVAIAKQKAYAYSELKGNILVLDKLQDPGNVGTLIRIAHWFGLGGVLLIKGSVDVHNPKVVRSSMGSLFHIPFYYCDQLEDSFLENRSLILSKAHSDKSIYDIKKSDIEPFMLVIGNEARGIDPAFDDFDHIDLTLPPLGGAESLNAAVAASAILSKLLY
ncbi:MAG: RNA methyltransferase [Candidatus Neomarinimicrobiota bacterium]